MLRSLVDASSQGFFRHRRVCSQILGCEGSMGKQYDEIDHGLEEFIGRQHVFFVATAPTSLEGHLNISPKGLNTFRVLGPRSVAYLDLTGSGIETVAHVRENGRLTIMFCGFEDRPLIVRLHGRARVVEPTDAEWNDLIAKFTEYPGARCIVVLDLQRIADSCGWAVPVLEYRGERSQLLDYANNKGPEGLERYRILNNAKSIDGLDGLPIHPGA
jgi:hypothetical protein